MSVEFSQKKLIPALESGLMFSASDPFEGVVMRRHFSGIGCGIPRAGLVSLHPGGPGLRPGDTTVALRGARWTGTGPDRPRPRKRGPGMTAGPTRAPAG